MKTLILLLSLLLCSCYSIPINGGCQPGPGYPLYRPTIHYGPVIPYYPRKPHFNVRVPYYPYYITRGAIRGFDN